jgi:hypothetical protein
VATERDVHIYSWFKTDRTLHAHFIHVCRGRCRLLFDGVISILFFGFFQTLEVEVRPSRNRTKVVVVAFIPVHVFAKRVIKFVVNYFAENFALTPDAPSGTCWPQGREICQW